MIYQTRNSLDIVSPQRQDVSHETTVQRFDEFLRATHQVRFPRLPPIFTVHSSDNPLIFTSVHSQVINLQATQDTVSPHVSRRQVGQRTSQRTSENKRNGDTNIYPLPIFFFGTNAREQLLTGQNGEICDGVDGQLVNQYPCQI